MSSFGETKPLGIIGGSGLETLPDIEIRERLPISTRYGAPSAPVTLGKIGPTPVAFIPRHGDKHHLAPHKVPYRANLEALRQLGVTQVIGTCIAGSLREEIRPSSLVCPDQFVNLTWGRDDIVEADGGSFSHLPMATPYCDCMRSWVLSSSASIHNQGTVVVIQGPRFSTVAESSWFIRNGWDLVNMTQYPECYFARDLGLCYAAIAGITDYDVGTERTLSMESDNMGRVLDHFKEVVAKTRHVLVSLCSSDAPLFNCGCAKMGEPYYVQAK
ncbi:MAG: MTAP family purine nucleoside phosphorylase [Bacillota bacterium]